MAVTNLAVQQITRAGLTPVFTAANGDGHYIVNNGNTTFLQVKNTNGAPITVTLDITKTVDGQAVTDRTVTVAQTSGDKMIGPFPKVDYDQSGAQAGSIKVTFSAVTDVTCAAFQI